MRKEKFNQKRKKKKTFGQSIWHALEPPRNCTKKGDENRSCKRWKPVSWIPWTAGRMMRTRRSMEVLQICRKRAMVVIVVVVVVVGSKKKNPTHLCKSVPCVSLSLSLFCLLCSSVHRKRRDSRLLCPVLLDPLLRLWPTPNPTVLIQSTSQSNS
jgi:hypothetical protein